jgi:hypothetical protein
LEYGLNCLDDLVLQLIRDVLIEVVALALHWVFDAVFDSQQSKQEEKAVVEVLLAGLTLVLRELDGRKDPLIDVAAVWSRTHVQRNQFFHFGIVHALTGRFAVCHLLQVLPCFII